MHTDRNRSNRRRNASGSRQGQALVESALILLSLLAMILFVVDMGRVLLLGQYVTERARITARAAVVNSWTERQVQNYLVYNRIQAPDENAEKPGFMGLRTSQVSYAVLGTLRNGDQRVRLRVSNINAVMFVPYLASVYKFPALTIEMPAQSLGATN